MLRLQSGDNLPTGDHRVSIGAFRQRVQALAPVFVAGALLSVMLFAGSAHAAGSSRSVAISRSGQIGPLAIDRSTDSDIRSAVGSPDYENTGNIDTGPLPNYSELGYTCHPSHGSMTCAMSFFVSQSTQRLESFTTTSPRFTLFGGVHVGMPANVASQREHEPNFDGCGQGITLDTPHLHVFVATRGGHEHSTRHGEVVSGGSVSEISIDQKHLGVGVTTC